MLILSDVIVVVIVSRISQCGGTGLMNSTNKKMWGSNALLLVVACIWGFAFVAQKVGNEYIGPFTFNGIRFLLGSISLLPLIFAFSFLSKRKNQKPNNHEKVELTDIDKHKSSKYVIMAGLICGAILFTGASLQQIGLMYTTAGKAAFVTGMYIVLVPIFGLFLKKRVGLFAAIGAVVAILGLFFLCIGEEFTISKGDWLQLVGAVFWALHILVIDHFSKRVDALKLSSLQFAVCGILSLIVAVATEAISMSAILQAATPILYGGLGSVGIAYTLQVVAQKHANPSHAAIIMSTESLFAVIGGALILNEVLLERQILGCILMLAGMLLSQLQSFKAKKV